MKKKKIKMGLYLCLCFSSLFLLFSSNNSAKANQLNTSQVEEIAEIKTMRLATQISTSAQAKITDNKFFWIIIIIPIILVIIILLEISLLLFYKKKDTKWLEEKLMM